MKAKTIGRIAKIASAVSDISTSKDKPEAIGRAVGTAAAAAGAVAHPIIGTAAAPAVQRGVAKATTAAVRKGVEIAHDPEVQAKAHEIGSRVQSGVREVGANITGRIAHFRDN